MSIETEPGNPTRPAWAKVVDQTRCIGCHACTTACKSENEVPLSVTRTYVKYVDTGAFPQARRSFQVTRCNQCEAPPCVSACPTSAMFKRADGIVDFDKSACIGCKACIAACPYDAIFINPQDHSAEKCNFCAHRLDVGLEPACVVVCPTEALLVGDMNDPSSQVARIINRDPVAVRRPEKETRPKLYYKGADQVTLDPLAAQRPEGGLFMWSEQGEVDHGVPSGHPGPWNSSAAAVLSYGHPAPGSVGLPRLALHLDQVHRRGRIPRAAPPAARRSDRCGHPAVDVRRPGRGRRLPGAHGRHPDLGPGAPLALPPHLQATPSGAAGWCAGGFIIGGYGAVLAAHFAVAWTGASPPMWLGWAGGGLAVLTAIYTAFLFGQAKARDMWQNPLLPAHFLVQAVMAGGGVMALAALALDGPAEPALRIFALGSAAHAAMILGEVMMPPPTAHARLAEREMTHGRFRGWFRLGLLGALVGARGAWLGWAVVPVGLVALLAYEHAYVQAGQSVPLS